MTFSLIPWWVWAALAAVLLAVALLYAPWIVALWARLPSWFRRVVVLVGTLGLAYIAGRNRGAHDVQEAQNKANARANEIRKEVDDEVSNLSDADLDKRYDRWVRKP